MQLLIDGGNTKTKYALYKGTECIDTQDSFNDKALVTLNTLLKKYSKSIEQAIISCVSELSSAISSTLKQEKIPFLTLEQDTPIPIKNAYNSPQTLGKDRLAIAVGAHALFPKEHVLVISCGTCITYNYIENSTFLGGAISPGVYQRLYVLNNQTAHLPFLEATANPSILGKDTQASILSGVMNGMAHEISGMIASYKEKHLLNKVIFTGGDAFYFEDLVKNATFVEPNIIFKGLKCILDYNQL